MELFPSISQVTAKTAFLFILPQYNVSVPTAGKKSTGLHLSRALVTPKFLENVLFLCMCMIILDT